MAAKRCNKSGAGDSEVVISEPFATRQTRSVELQSATSADRFAGQLGADLTYTYCCTAPTTNCHRLAKTGMQQQRLNRTENECERTFPALFTTESAEGGNQLTVTSCKQSRHASF